jgi:hypothetical protein
MLTVVDDDARVIQLIVGRGSVAIGLEEPVDASSDFMRYGVATGGALLFAST